MAKATKTTAPAKAKAAKASKPAAAAAKSKAPPAKATPAVKPTAISTPAKASAKPAAKPAVNRAAKTAPAAKPAQPPAAKTAAAKPASKPSPGAAKKLPNTLTALAAGLPEKPWLKSYSKVVPAEIGALPYSSIGDFLVGACKQFSGQPAYVCMGKSISYAELERQSAAFGAYLQSKGLQKGARVALMMPNVLQYPVAMMAVLRAGYIVVNINPLYTPRELEHQLKDSGAQAIVILENFASTLDAVIARTAVKHVVVAAMGDMLGALKGTIVNLVVRRVKKMVPAWSLPGHVKFNAAVKAGAGIAFKPAKMEAGDVAFLQYTGGTTGISKGAVLLHSNVLSNVAQNTLWLQDAYAIKPKPAHLNFICALPLYHIFALTVNALMGMQQGAQNVLVPNPRDIPGFVKELQKYPMHIFPGLNTLFNALLNNEDFRKLDFKPLIMTLGGGMAVQKGVAERWKALTGNSITEGYGLSETSPVATANKFSDSNFTGTIGLPLPSTEIVIRDDDGNNLPLGEVGEICIRGPQVMAGYWNRPDETAKVMTKDGFFKSGDMGFMDERGYTKIVDRKKDMILVSGFNVYPNELEEVIAQHPGVLEVAAVGVPDEHSGEVPKLFIVKKDPALTVEALTAYCRENLTGYKRPKYIEFRTELPKTPVGKILRRALRE
ncbi:MULTISPECIES: long-chain fatty acid--CoA ligase [unclassified Mesorhizobium]|uniref:long-chain fatty acid--CoA ligase n=1 Tax=unclassified Mesorhizobium TaxID=325217 RepID=UPI0003CF9891|nr:MULTISPECIES: long-chain fatty acid--CoA ligase [unclassified Mesorhizobium]ESX21612.1 long-chain fatty acid--CoA ligase [Mesorhizobium sp. LSJC255A00]ESX28467.1 long-chain fatty acid--CoA ligase [Mesorhizobium sp. LSHC440B00]ESX37364.1 long-chain fatty acid--CoA ligase [Mesorhizobium sp. LSHC432A00]ESX42301.1 long-chain fatty acid--CoA ligase [Mesorhizobium sp. LSHC440A00]ESX77060.1 long-chain fatty acid--CoA ligase [Mesorhizobium sp. LSHC414A00]